MSLLGAVAPSQAPQTGVKRALQSNPVAVPNNLPAFRGRDVGPGGNVKVPKLNQGNKPNQQTNVAIPYNRVCPLEFLSGWTGRLAPGDVAFVLKYPPGFLASLPNSNNATAATATMSRVIGVDGVNRMLHGSSNPQGWRVGVNVLYVNDPNDPGVASTGPMEIKRVVNTNLVQKEEFRLDVLDNTRVDGIIKSNDEPHSFTSNGSRDAVVFNNVLQGPTLVNNGYLLYDPDANPTYNVQSGNRQKHGAQPLRTVEAHPRGSIEGGYHLGGGSGRPGVVGSQSWLFDGQYDYVAAFTGTYTAYPGQMFDRQVQPLNSLYLGLRAHALSTESKLKMTRADGKLVFDDPDPAQNRLNATQAECYFYQYLPFASRKAWLCQHVQDEVAKANFSAYFLHFHRRGCFHARNLFSAYLLARICERRVRSCAQGLNQAPPVSAKTTIDRINNHIVNHNKGDKKSRFDDDIFDAVRTEDLANMVGAWHLGRVLDIKSQRLTAYDGGPSDTGFSLMVDVQIGWRNAKLKPGGAPNLTQQAVDTLLVGQAYTSRAHDPATGLQIPRLLAEMDALDRRQVDQHNAQNPPLQSTIGMIVGSALQADNQLSLTNTAAQNDRQLKIARTIGGRWPVLDKAWKAIVYTLYGMEGGVAFDGNVTDQADLLEQWPADLDFVESPQARATPYVLTGVVDGKNTVVSFSIETLVRLVIDAHHPINAKAAHKALLPVLRSIGLDVRVLYRLDADGNYEVQNKGRLSTMLTNLFRPVLGPKIKRDGAQMPKFLRSLITREGFFFTLAGLRVKKNIRADWFKYGPAMFPTLAQPDDDPAIGNDNFSLERLEAEAELSEHSEWHESEHLCIGLTVYGLNPVELESLRADAKLRLDLISSSSGTRLGDAPISTTPAPTSAPIAAAATAALERSAPITAAAISSRKRVSSKTPPRTRPAPAATASAATASATAPIATTTTAVRPLLPALAPSVASTESASPSAGPTGGLANPPAATRRRDRGAAGQSSSTVSAIFDGLFGSGLEQAASSTEFGEEGLHPIHPHHRPDLSKGVGLALRHFGEVLEGAADRANAALANHTQTQYILV